MAILALLAVELDSAAAASLRRVVEAFTDAALAALAPLSGSAPLAACCIEGEEFPAALHVCGQPTLDGLRESSAPLYDLWMPYASWGGSVVDLEKAFDRDFDDAWSAVVAALDGRGVVDPSLYARSRVARALTTAAGTRVRVSDEFVAYAFTADLEDEVWRTLRVSTDLRRWDALHARGLLDEGAWAQLRFSTD